ncbi:LysE family translocator [Acetobacteraceae bacterium]|nr:LysE family translocator [Acetobacteraceae bacterium]
MLSQLSLLLPFTIFWIGCVFVPGLDFVFVSRTAAMQGRMAGIMASLGVSVGSTIWGIAGYFGIHALFVLEPKLFLGMKMAGGLYLIWVGSKLLRGQGHDTGLQGTSTTQVLKLGNVFWAGVLCDLSNPKTLVFMSSLFASAFPENASSALGLAAILMIFFSTFLIMGAIAVCLAAPIVSTWFWRQRLVIDRCAGLIFILLGGGFVLETLPMPSIGRLFSKMMA